jgi:hypothetical protein
MSAMSFPTAITPSPVAAIPFILCPVMVVSLVHQPFQTFTDKAQNLGESTAE